MDKQRLVVMNGHCFLQSFGENNKWLDQKVEKAGPRPPGLYNLYAASPPEPGKAHDGLVMYADGENVYQLVGKAMIRHPRAAFQALPTVGAAQSISYAKGQALVTESLGKSRSRSL